MDDYQRVLIDRGRWDGRYSDADVDRLFVAGAWRRFTPAELRALGVEPGFPGGPLDCILYATATRTEQLP